MSKQRMAQIGAAGGIVWVVLQLVAQSLIQVGGTEPAFNSGAAEIAAFFVGRDARLFGWGDFLSTLSVVPFVWFLGVLWAALNQAESAPAWMSNVAFGSGLLMASQMVSSSGWTLAMARIGEGLDEQLLAFLFDEGNLGFANVWMSLASMLGATGMVTITREALPKWLGWAALVLAVGMVAARAVWASSAAAFAPYGLFWLWTIAASIALMRQAARASAAH